jgi:hypothetical protein
VLAAGRATLDRHGETFEVIRPVLLETESALEKISPGDRARWRWALARPAQFLMLARVDRPPG